ncbi:MAG: S41 family peptidase, partial [Acidobacteria bacterium]|nr:S41 family peptidase [Acidobacteriota bacterium]
MKKTMILILSIFFAYGVVQSWQFNLDSPAGNREERELLNLLYDAVYQVEDRAKYPKDDDELFNIVLDEMLQNLDPHSNYFSPESYKELLEDQEGHFFGIGVLISKPSPEAPLIVINPIEGTPAHRAGLRSGDIITEVEGKPTDKMTTKEAVKMLKGPKGTEVTISVRRGEDEPFRVKLKRDEIPKNSVSYSFVLEEDIGYIRISYFGETTAEEVKKALKDLKKEGAKSYILDFRDNPGGSLKAAVDLCSIFLPEESPIVSVKPRRGPERNFSSFGCREFCKVPLAVLINTGSASASEIVAGALKDNKRAKIVGTKSWGKGLVQTVTPLIRGAVAVTTAHYFTPSNVNIQRSYESRENYFFPEIMGVESKREGGIEPDVYVTQEEIPP